MQKKLIALAVTGLLSTGAFAQSSAVTVYGVADLSFDVVKSSGDPWNFGPGGSGSANVGSHTRVSSNGSYIGFKGTEDLGNGLKALFQFETGLNVDGDKGGNSLFGNGTTRDSFVGLSGGFGEVKLGTLTTPTRALGLAMDVNAGATGIGDNKALINTSARFGSVFVPFAGFDVRQGNTIQYTTPSMAGFSAAAAYISGEDKRADGFNNPRNSKAWDLGLNYNNGPILVGAAYAVAKDNYSWDGKIKNARIAGAYDFGVASVRLLWNQTKTEANIGGGFDHKQNVWGIGGTYNVVSNGKLIAQYYAAQDEKFNGNKLADTGAKLFEIGYEHSLSKRTMLKLVYARLNNEANADFNFATNPVNTAYFNNGGVDPSGLQIGIRHSF